MLRMLAAIAALTAALIAPQASGQSGPLSISPDTQPGCVFLGPRGGPYSRTNCDFTLTNTTAAAITVSAWRSVAFEPPWLNITVNGAPLTNEFSNPATLNLPANGSVSVVLTPRDGFPAPDAGSIGSAAFRASGSAQQVNASARVDLTAGNDNFGSAIPLGTGAVTNTNFVTTGATKEPGEPNHANNPGGASVWWRYTPALNGSVTIPLEFTNFNALLAVYTGSSVSALTPVASATGANASVTFPVVGGTAYAIAVDGASGATGFGQFRIVENLQIANDNFANAQTFPGAGGSFQQYSSFMLQPTRETGEPAHGGSGAGGVWYRWTAPASGVFRFQTSVSTPNPPITAVYLGDSISSLSEVASTSVFAGRANFTDFTAVAGLTYHLAVAASQENTPFTVSLQLSPQQKPTGLFASLLPTSRAGAPGEPLTAFANMINTTNQTGINCRPVHPNIFFNITPAGAGYQTTSALNELVGAPNTPVNIPPGATQNFIVQVQRGQEMTSGVVGFRFTCDNLADAPLYPDANGWVLRYVLPAPADIVAIGATPAGPPPGVVDLSAGISVFAVAGINIGEPKPIAAVPRATRPGVEMLVCETDLQGICVAPPSPFVSIPFFDEFEGRVFAIFVNPLGPAIPFDPGLTRLLLEFRQGGPAGMIVGATSVAVQRF